MQLSFFALTVDGSPLAARLADHFQGALYLPARFASSYPGAEGCAKTTQALKERFECDEGLVCVMSSGVVIRTLAPLIVSKKSDPAIVVLDEQGRFAIPLLSGHLGGAVPLAKAIADFLEGQVVLTTSSDVQGLVAPDVLARERGYAIGNFDDHLAVTSILVNKGSVYIEAAADPAVPGYEWVALGADRPAGADARVLIDDKLQERNDWPLPTLQLVPRSLVAGIGCKRGESKENILGALEQVCAGLGYDSRAVGRIGSITQKADEAGLLKAAETLGAKLTFFEAQELAKVAHDGSDFVEQTVGVKAVCEPAAALLSGSRNQLLTSKTVVGKVTVALAAASSTP